MSGNACTFTRSRLLVLTLVLLFVAVPALAQSNELQLNLPFRNIGPAITGGKATAVAGVPGNYNVYYVGTGGGGLWKTVNGGASWQAIFAHGPSGSIGTIALSPKDSQVIWLGTGETDLRNAAVDGRGLFLSTDGGKTWQARGFTNAGQIASVSVNPDDPNTVVVGVLGQVSKPNDERGVFRTTDGGKTWKKVLYVNSTTGCIQVARVPGNPNILFAAMWQEIRKPWLMKEGGYSSGIYRSMDGGKTWHKLTNGLPPEPWGRIGLAIAPSNPKRIYAEIYAKTGRLWMSNDKGNSWEFVSDNHALSGRPMYFSVLAVSPTDENKVYFTSVEFLESDDGGKTVHPIDRGVHGDYHAIWIDPDNADHILVGNDGGAFVTVDGGQHWASLTNFPAGQYYAVSATPMPDGTPYMICGGMQDDGAWCGPSSDLNRPNLNGRAFKELSGADGNYVVPSPSDPNIIYMTLATVSAGAFYRYDARTGVSVFERPAWWVVNELGPSHIKYRWTEPTPIAISRTDPNTVYTAANAVFKSTTGGKQWQVISPDLTRNDKKLQHETGMSPVPIEYTTAPDLILSLSIARTDPDVLWAGTDDGLVWVTHDDGGHWDNVTPRLTGVPPWARVYQVGVSPFDAGSAYIAMDASRVGDYRIYVYKTHDYGKTWTEITNGLPADEPGHVVREDPNKRGLLVLGTDISLYYSMDDGAHWSLLSKDFPTTPVWDLHFVKRAHALVAATVQRGIFTFDNLRPLEEQNNIADKKFYVFAPAPGTLFYTKREDMPRLPYYSVPNVPMGVSMSYYVAPEAAKAGEPVQITVKDFAGRMVSEFHGSAHAGLNEATWNMRYSGPTELDFEKPAYNPPQRGGFFGSFGPLVLPGRYSIELAYGRSRQTIAGVVRPDLRLNISDAQMHAYLGAALELRNEASALNGMLNQIVELRSRIAALESDSEPDAVARQARSIDMQLQRIEDEVFDPQIQHNAPEDMLHALFRTYGKLTRLFRVVSFSYYEVPSPPMSAAMQVVKHELDSALHDYNQVVSTGIPALNQVLRGAGMQPVQGIPEIKIKPINQMSTNSATPISFKSPLTQLRRSRTGLIRPTIG